MERGRGDGVLLFFIYLFIYLTFDYSISYFLFFLIFLVTIYNRNFYTPAQYVGALIVLGGLVVSVLPAFLNSKTSNAGPPMFDLVSLLTLFSSPLPVLFHSVVPSLKSLGAVLDQHRVISLFTSSLSLFTSSSNLLILFPPLYFFFPD